MKLFEFISAISFMTFTFGLLINFLMIIPSTLVMTLKGTEKTLFWLKAITRILITSIIAYYILTFTSDKSFANSVGLYILGFYFYFVIFTLGDEIEKEKAQENQKTYVNYVFFKATSFNSILVLVALVYFTLAIIFPILTNFYIPSLFLDLYNWLFSFKIISWIIFLIGGLAIVYTIQHTFLLVLFIVRKILD